MKKTGNLAGQPPTEETVLKLCLSFAKTTVQLSNRRARKNVKSITRLFSDTNFDAAGHPRSVIETGDCKLIPGNSRGESLAGDGLAKNNVESGSRLSVRGAALSKKGFLGVSLSQVEVSSL